MPMVDVDGIGSFDDRDERDVPGERWSRPMTGVFYDNPPPTVAHATSIQDMCDEEIQAMADMNMFTGKPIRYDHREGTDCGVIDKVWRDGRRWMVEFRLDQSIPAGRLLTRRVRSGLTRGLSLHHEYHSRLPLEISICPRGARPGTTVVQASDHEAEARELEYKARLNRVFRMCWAAKHPITIAASEMDGQGSYHGSRTRTTRRPDSEPVTLDAPVTDAEWEQQRILMNNQLRQLHGIPHPTDRRVTETYEQKRQRIFEEEQAKVLEEKAAYEAQRQYRPPQQQQQPLPLPQQPLPLPQQQQQYQQPQQALAFPPQPQQFMAPPSLSEVNIKFPDGYTDEQKLKFIRENWENANNTNPALMRQKQLLDKGITPTSGPRVVLGEDQEMEPEKPKEAKPAKDDTKRSTADELRDKRIAELESALSKRDFEDAWSRFLNIRGRDAGSGDSLERLRKSHEALWNSGEAGKQAFLDLIANEEVVVGRKHSRRRREENDAEDSADEENPRSRSSKSTPAASSSSSTAAAAPGKIGYEEFMKMAETARSQKLADIAPSPPAPSPVSVAASASEPTPFQRRIASIQASNPTMAASDQAITTLQMIQENGAAQRAGSHVFMTRGRNGQVEFNTPSSFNENGGKGLWQETARIPDYIRSRFSDMYDITGRAVSGY